MTEPYNLRGIPSNTIDGDRFKVTVDGIQVDPPEVNFPATYPLPQAQVDALAPQSNGLTDAELRASPVEVSLNGEPVAYAQSGAWSVGINNLPSIYPNQHSQPLTNGQLRASDVVVSLDGESVSVGNFPASYPLPASQVQTDALTDQQLRAAPIEVSGSATGTWDYVAGTSGTQALPVNSRVLQISAMASTAGGSISINGGDSIPIPGGRSVTIEPKGNLSAPSVVFTGTSAYLVEFVV